MGGEGLEVGGDAGAGGGVVTCDGEESAFGRGRNGRNRRHLGATRLSENRIIPEGILQPKTGNNYL